MTHTYTNLNIHFVWGTKYRLDLIKPSMRKNLYDYIGSVIGAKPGCVLIAAGGIGNHIHLLIKLSAQQSPAALIRVIKAQSSLYMRKNYSELNFSWQAGYGGFAVSASLIEKVKSYIDQQEIHHKEYSFEKEFEGLLKKHNLIIESGCWVDNDGDDD